MAFEMLQKLSANYEKILKDNGIIDEISEIVEHSPPDLEAAGMTSKPVYVTVKFKNPVVKPLNLFVKTQISDESRGEMFKRMKLVEKEVRFLTEYVPAVKEFCKSKGCDNLLDFYPKCYYGDSEMIVLENLVMDKGYIILSKQERQGLEPAKKALTSLAKHHAVSHAFIKEIGGPEVFFKRFPNLNFEAFNEDIVRDWVEPLVENGISNNIKLLEKCDIIGKEDAVKLLRAHAGKAYSILLDTLNSPLENEKLVTLNHGDYWNNNMMFLWDEETNKFTGHVVLDYQCLRYNSPALDIGNFMYTSMKPEARRVHLYDLITLYLDVLRTTANDLGHPIEISFEEFFTLFRKKMKYGFWFAIWLAVDVGYAVINNVDKEAVDFDDWPVKFDMLVQKWIDENPEKSMKCARDLMEIMKEYSNLVVE